MSGSFEIIGALEVQQEHAAVIDATFDIAADIEVGGAGATLDAQFDIAADIEIGGAGFTLDALFDIAADLTAASAIQPATPGASVHRFCAQNLNTLAAAVVSATNQRTSDLIYRTARTGTGTGRVMLSGDYVGAEDAEFDVEILDGGTTPRTTVPRFIGVGSGTLDDVSADAGATNETITLTLKSTGTDTAAAEVDFEGVTLRAKATGSEGNAIVITADTSGISYAASAYSLLADIAIGTETLEGPTWDWNTVTGSKSVVPAAARRMAIGDDRSVVYLQWKYYEDGRWHYRLLPEAQRKYDAGARIYEVSGTYSVTITDGVTPETYSDLVTLYDLLDAIRSESDLIEVVESFSSARTVDNLTGTVDLRTRTEALLLDNRGSGSEYGSGGFENVTVESTAATERIVAKCLANSPTSGSGTGSERWSVKGSVSGDLGTFASGDTVSVAGRFSARIPVRLPEGYSPGCQTRMSAKVNLVARDEGVVPPQICVAALRAGPNATPRTITFTYKARQLGSGGTQDGTCIGGTYYYPISEVCKTGGLEVADPPATSNTCWQQPTGQEYWWVPDDVTYLPALTWTEYASARYGCDGVGWDPTYEFSFAIRHILYTGHGDLMEGDQVAISICDIGTAAAYQVGDELILEMLAANPIELQGGAAGDDTQTWAVTGSETGRMTDYAVVDGAEADYNAHNLHFTVYRGAVANVVGDSWQFDVEAGQYQWRKDGGDWSALADIPTSGTVSLSDGVEASFSGGGGGFDEGDLFNFLAEQRYAPSHAKVPSEEIWAWSGTGTVYTADLGVTSTVTAFGIARHTLPLGASLMLEGGTDGSTWPKSKVVTWRRGPIYQELGETWSVRYLRLTIANAGGAQIGWLWAGVPYAPALNAESVQLVRQYARTRGSGFAPSAIYRGAASGGSIGWDNWLLQADRNALMEIVDDAAEHDWPILFVPQHSHADEACLVGIDVDRLEWTDYHQFHPSDRDRRRMGLTLPLSGIYE